MKPKSGFEISISPNCRSDLGFSVNVDIEKGLREHQAKSLVKLLDKLLANVSVDEINQILTDKRGKESA